MIHVFGDSHGSFLLKGSDINYNNHSYPSVTMYRIGRDNIIINYNKSYESVNNIFVFEYGEVDCRCHVHRQKMLGRDVDEICSELVLKYFNTIKNNIKIYKKIIICAVVPPIQKHEYENIHGPITHEFPFVGTYDERVIYTNKINNLLKQHCIENNFIYFDPYDYYKNSNGTLNFSLSDNNIHIRDNRYIIEKFKEFLKDI
jgi:hypothetical protein